MTTSVAGKTLQELIAEHPQCSVCQENFRKAGEASQVDESQITRLACDHLYHTPCITPWVTAKLNEAAGPDGGPGPNCPECRAPIQGEILTALGGPAAQGPVAQMPPAGGQGILGYELRYLIERITLPILRPNDLNEVRLIALHSPDQAIREAGTRLLAEIRLRVQTESSFILGQVSAQTLTDTREIIAQLQERELNLFRNDALLHQTVINLLEPVPALRDLYESHLEYARDGQASQDFRRVRNELDRMSMPRWMSVVIRGLNVAVVSKITPKLMLASEGTRIAPLFVIVGSFAIAVAAVAGVHLLVNKGVEYACKKEEGSIREEIRVGNAIKIAILAFMTAALWMFGGS